MPRAQVNKDTARLRQNLGALYREERATREERWKRGVPINRITDKRGRPPHRPRPV